MSYEIHFLDERIVQQCFFRLFPATRGNPAKEICGDILRENTMCFPMNFFNLANLFQTARH